MEEGDSEEIVRALGYIARARGMTQLAKDTGSVVKVFIKRFHLINPHDLTLFCG